MTSMYLPADNLNPARTWEDIPPGEKVSEAEWENICDGCGKCCAQHTIGEPKGCYACPSLDTTTNRCMNYKDRLEVQICTKVSPSNVFYLHHNKVLPDSCAYVRHMQGKEPLPRPVEEARLIPFILAPEKYQKQYLKHRRLWSDFMGTKF